MIVVQPVLSFASSRKPLPRVRAAQQPRNDSARKVPPVPPERSIPAGLNLPNLEEVRQRRHEKPEAPALIESTMRSRRKADKPREKKKSHHASSHGTLTTKV